jgi:hypothetical protein
LIDSGATHSIINFRALNKHLKGTVNKFLVEPEKSSQNGLRLTTIRFQGPFGDMFEEVCVNADVKIKIGNWFGWHSFIISKKLGKEKAILGADFLNQHDYVKTNNTFKIYKKGEFMQQATAFISQDQIIPANSEMLIDCYSNRAFVNNLMCVDPYDHSNHGLAIAKSVNKVCNGQFQICVLNYNEKPVKLNRGHSFGMLYKPEAVFNCDEVLDSEQNNVELREIHNQNNTNQPTNQPRSPRDRPTSTSIQT